MYLSNLPDLTRIHGVAIDFVGDITRINGDTKVNLEASKSKYTVVVDACRRHLVFEVSNLVWVVLT